MANSASYAMPIHQSNLNTSQMGVIEAASSYFGLPWSVPDLFVGGGHAFVTNVSHDLCPSSPYVWQTMKTWPLYKNLNLSVEMIGFTLPGESSDDEREKFNESLIEALDAGKACSVLCLDHQVVVGYDQQGFVLSQPWGPMPDADPTPPRLTFDSWEGFLNGPPLIAFTMSKSNGSNSSWRDSLNDAVSYALDVWDNPNNHTEGEIYGMGPDAYVNWLKGLEDGFGNQHGAWWNGIVWSECKYMASTFFAVQPDSLNLPAELTQNLSSAYSDAASALMKASEKELDTSHKKEAVERASRAESSAVSLLREIPALLH